MYSLYILTSLITGLNVYISCELAGQATFTVCSNGGLNQMIRFIMMTERARNHDHIAFEHVQRQHRNIREGKWIKYILLHPLNQYWIRFFHSGVNWISTVHCYSLRCRNLRWNNKWNVLRDPSILLLLELSVAVISIRSNWAYWQRWRREWRIMMNYIKQHFFFEGVQNHK